MRKVCATSIRWRVSSVCRPWASTPFSGPFAPLTPLFTLSPVILPRLEQPLQQLLLALVELLVVDGARLVLLLQLGHLVMDRGLVVVLPLGLVEEGLEDPSRPRDRTAH